MSIFFIENNPQSVSTLTRTNRHTEIHHQEKKKKKAVLLEARTKVNELNNYFLSTIPDKKAKIAGRFHSLSAFTALLTLLKKYVYCRGQRETLSLSPARNKCTDKEYTCTLQGVSLGPNTDFAAPGFNVQLQSSKNMSEVYRVNYIDKTSITSCDVVSAVFSTEVLFVAFRLNTQVKPEIKRKRGVHTRYDILLDICNILKLSANRSSWR